VAPNIAVTNDHNLNLLSADMVLARSPAYDLLFFRTERTHVAPITSPKVGQTVIAYGQNGRSGRREAKGIVRELDARAFALCANCPERPAITYDAEAGEGFSGGPVVDVTSGGVVGITVGYLDGAAEDGGRRMYAMDIDFVMAELRRLIPGEIARPAQ
jgi:S1-C subfamily serine protease